MRVPLLAILLIAAASAKAAPLTPPALIPVERVPEGPDFPNITCALSAITVNPDGTLSVSVTFPSEPQSEPALILRYARRADAEVIEQTALASDWALSAEALSSYTYTFTFPAVPDAVDPARTVVVRRVRFGRPGGSFEGGGFAVVTDAGTFLGRSGVYTVGGETVTFRGGVAVDPRAALDESGSAETPAPMMLRAAPMTDRPTVAGRRLAFPLPKGPQK